MLLASRKNNSFAAFGAGGRRILAAAVGWLVTLVLLSSVSAFGATEVDSYGSSARSIVRRGDQGPEVILVQHALYQLGYLSDQPDGFFGPATQRAVEQFQSDSNITADGIVGPQTWSSLGNALPRAHKHIVAPGDTLWEISRMYGVSISTIVETNQIANPDRIRVGQVLVIPFGSVPASTGVHWVAGGPVELLHWSEAQQLYRSFTTARVIDVETGRSFYVQRYYGTLHADSEPLTAEDARIMREIYGGQWSWERRAIIVEIDGRRIAASMNGQPHGSGAVEGNGFDGHFCIHFLGSRLHLNGKLDPDHHEKILMAAGYTNVGQIWLGN